MAAHERTAKRDWRGAAVNLALAAASVLVVLLLLEGVLALTGAVEPDPPLLPGDITPPADDNIDPLIGWKLAPGSVVHETTEHLSGTYRANRQGFRSPRDFRADTRRRKIVFLGDSFTFGSGVSYGETFVARIERRLPGVRAFNLGMGGFGIDQMWMTLRHYGLPLAPDLVVLSFIRNDLDRSLSAYRMGHVWFAKPTFRLRGERLEPLTASGGPVPLRRLLIRHSRLAELGRRLDRSLSWRFAVGRRWRLNRALFAAVRDDCRAAGVPLAVVHLPVGRLRPATALAPDFAALEIPFLDLAPLLPADPEPLYYGDGHFNAAGHAFAAEAIADFLSARGLAPEASRGRSRPAPGSPPSSRRSAPDPPR